MQKVLDIERLKETQQQFQLELKNRFSLLEEQATDDELGIEEDWGTIKETIMNTAETWPMTVANMKRLEAAHHRWQRKILGIVWKDKITNEDVRRTWMDKLEDIIRRK